MSILKVLGHTRDWILAPQSLDRVTQTHMVVNRSQEQI